MFVRHFYELFVCLKKRSTAFKIRRNLQMQRTSLSFEDARNYSGAADTGKPLQGLSDMFRTSAVISGPELFQKSPKQIWKLLCGQWKQNLKSFMESNRAHLASAVCISTDTSEPKMWAVSTSTDTINREQHVQHLLPSKCQFGGGFLHMSARQSWADLWHSIKNHSGPQFRIRHNMEIVPLPSLQQLGYNWAAVLMKSKPSAGNDANTSMLLT